MKQTRTATPIMFILALLVGGTIMALGGHGSAPSAGATSTASAAPSKRPLPKAPSTSPSPDNQITFKVWWWPRTNITISAREIVGNIDTHWHDVPSIPGKYDPWVSPKYPYRLPATIHLMIKQPFSQNRELELTCGIYVGKKRVVYETARSDSSYVSFTHQCEYKGG